MDNKHTLKMTHSKSSLLISERSKMGNLGISVMLAYLAGNADSVEAFTGAVGKEIANLELVNDELRFIFTDGSGVKLFDDGQSCCELRYMVTDDNLGDFVGAKLLGAEIRDAPDEYDEYGKVYEVQFLLVTTDKGVFTMATHNEHNGYYGGFDIRADTF